MGCFVPTGTGFLASAVISFLMLSIAFSKIAGIRIREGVRREKSYFFTSSLAYFSLWLIAILVGGSIFNLEIAPYLAQIAIYCIIMPYFLGTFLYIFGFLSTLRW